MPQKIYSLAFLICFSLALPAQALETASPESVGMSTERLARIDKAMQRYIDKKLVAGTVTLVARKGKLVHLSAQGFMDVENNTPMQEDTIFRIASMTKPITSVALLMLFEEGHFLLNEPIAKFLPEFKNMQVAVPPADNEYHGTPYKTVPATRPITFKHILTHTAGLANSYRGLTQPEYRKISAKQDENETVADLVKRVAKLPLNFHPGDKWEYSIATDVAGVLVEVISGQTLAEFFEQRIFTPLGMKDTYFYLPEEKTERFAALYTPDEDKKIKLTETGDKNSRFVKPPHVYFRGAGGLVSTARDYARFHQMMLNGGKLGNVRLLGRKTVELMIINHTGDLPVWLRGPGAGFGLGYSVITDRGQAQSMSSEGAYGWGGAYCTYFWVDPKEEVVGIVMTQVRPYTHLNIRREFENLTNQAIVD